MKTIGLIGGVTWQSTVDYYRIINNQVGRRLGEKHSAKILLSSVDFHPLEKLAREGKWETIGEILQREALRLEKAGSDLFLICANTLHKVADSICKSVSIPLVHIVKETAAETRRRGFRKVGLLATRFTMESTFYQSEMSRFEVEVTVPDERSRETVHRIIFDELVHGRITESSRKLCQGIIEELRGDGAEAVILGCTEIPLLIGDQDVSIPTLNTTEIHAGAAVREALK